MEQIYIPARTTQLNYYKNVPLYVQGKGQKFVLYKPSGMTLHDMRVAEGLHPKKLYIKQTDKIAGIQEVQKVFNHQLKENIQSNNPEKIRVTVVSIMEETLTEPRSGSLEGVSDTVNILVDGSGYPNQLRQISEVSQIISFIDCYEALTSDDRPYRNSMDPLKALVLIKKDVEAGKFDKNIFEKFAYSLL